MASVDEHVNALLALPPEERERVGHLLLDSVESEHPGELSEAWIAEIQRRIDAVDNGTSKLIPYDEVQRQVAAKLEALRKRR